MSHADPASPSSHSWKFVRIGGLDQVCLETADDLRALRHLDQKLWVALSCPVKGLELDEKTLALIDTDKDGRIRVPELLAAIDWSAARLSDLSLLLSGQPELPLSAFDPTSPAGAAALTSAKRILANLGKPDASTLTLAEASDIARVFATTQFNGDGIITPGSTDVPELKLLLADVLATLGGTPDRSGAEGIDLSRLDTFYADCAAFTQWTAAGASPEVLPLGPATTAAHASLEAVRSKVDDFFTRSRLAAFEPRAQGALNRSEADYLALAAQDLTFTAEEFRAFPLALVQPGSPLPLIDGVNPAWSDALAALHRDAVTPLLGPDRTALTAADWKELKSKLAPHRAWLAAKTGSAVEKLGLERLHAILADNHRDALANLITQDKALEPEFQALADVESLLRYARDFRALLHNFVNFHDFYSPDRYGIFQAGVLYLDARSTELCLRVTGPSPLAASSNLYLAYCDVKRPNGEAMKIVAAFTQGDSDYLCVGRNGIFYDRQGRDWDATITSISDQPISIRQAFWSPYKKVARLVESQIAKFAAEKDKAADAKLAAGVTTPPLGSPATPGASGAPKTAFDIAKFAGIFAAVGIALGMIGGAIAAIVTGFLGLSWWQMPLALLGALLVVSGPSMLLAALKLRQRTLGPVLDANGWAINGRVKINIPFGTKLTERAVFPAGSQRSLKDPYEDDAAARKRRLLLLVLLAALAGVIRWQAVRQGHYFWQDAPPPPAAESPALPPEA